MSRLSVSSVVAVGLMVSACGADAPSATQTNPENSAEAIAQVLPTGDCALVVKRVRHVEDIGDPEVAAILDAPPLDAAYRVELDMEPVSGMPWAGISVFGENWGTEVHVFQTAPNGTVESYTNANRPRHNQSMTAAFTEVGTYVIEMWSTSTDCAATLVFEVTEPA